MKSILCYCIPIASYNESRYCCNNAKKHLAIKWSPRRETTEGKALHALFIERVVTRLPDNNIPSVIFKYWPSAFPTHIQSKNPMIIFIV